MPAIGIISSNTAATPKLQTCKRCLAGDKYERFYLVYAPRLCSTWFSRCMRLIPLS